MAVTISLGACTIHPAGEREARDDSTHAGQAYTRPFEERSPPALEANPTGEDLVRYALLTNAELEAKYWAWRAALEQVPQEGTQKTNLMLSLQGMIENGETALENTSFGIGNDSMASLALPSKLGSQASVALHEARAAGFRFDKARFELRNKVLAAYYDFALTAEQLRLEEENIRLLEFTAKVTESRLSTGTASQTDLLRSGNEVEFAKNRAGSLRAKLPQERAAINALLNRPHDAALEPPAKLPTAGDVALDDAAILERVARNNPELTALAQEISGKKDALERARLEYLPDFNVNVTADFAGVSQALMGSVVVPYLRHEALDAGIRQASANLWAAQAMQRQTAHDLTTRVIADLAMLRDAQRQLEVFDKTLLPRANQIITASQNAYASGRLGGPAGGGGGMGGAGGGMGGAAATGGGLLDLLDAQRSLIALRRMRAEMQIEPLKQLADLEEIAGQPLSVAVTSTTAPASTLP